MKKDFMLGVKKTVADLAPSTFSEIEKIKKKIVVVDELKNLIPQLSEEEYQQLEENIKKFGCKDPLLVWETTEDTIYKNSIEDKIYVLVDGHNRYSICSKFKIDFKITIQSFSNIDVVKDYMIDFQLGRRNLNPEQVSYFRGLRYNREKSIKGKYERNGATKNAAEMLAKQHNVSPRTIKNDANFANGVAKLPEQIKHDFLSGKISLKKEDIQKIGKGEYNLSNDFNLEQIKIVISGKNKLSDSVVTLDRNNLKSEIVVLVNNISTKKDCKHIIDKLKKLEKLL